MEKNKTKYSNTMIMSVSCGYVKWIMALEKWMVVALLVRLIGSHRIGLDWFEQEESIHLEHGTCSVLVV